MKALRTTLILGLLAIPCQGGLITHTDYTSGATITASGQNTNENLIFNEFNGNIDNNNIKSGAAIANNKLIANTASTIALTDSSGYLTTSVSNITSASSFTVTGTITATSSMTLTNVLNVSSITMSNAAGGILANTTGVLASTGVVGMYVSSFTSNSGQNASTSNQYGDVVNITLPAGHWLISGQLVVQTNGATMSSASQLGISTTAGNSSTGLVEGTNRMDMGTFNVTSYSLTISNYHVAPTATTTYYLKSFNTYSSGPPLLYGGLSAVCIH